VKEEGWHKGWFDHPLRPLGWLGHHQTGLRGCHPSSFTFFFSLSFNRGWSGHPLCHPSSFTFFFFFFSLTGGGPATPLGHWGGLATTRLAGGGQATPLVVAQPPQWPKGWLATPYGWIGHPSSFTFFFF
jgi:hypothetical protein